MLFNNQLPQQRHLKAFCLAEERLSLAACRVGFQFILLLWLVAVTSQTNLWWGSRRQQSQRSLCLLTIFSFFLVSCTAPSSETVLIHVSSILNTLSWKYARPPGGPIPYRFLTTPATMWLKPSVIKCSVFLWAVSVTEVSLRFRSFIICYLLRRLSEANPYPSSCQQSRDNSSPQEREVSRGFMLPFFPTACSGFDLYF